jgi:hypothetical protein
MRYIILTLDDALALGKGESVPETQRRLVVEQGADIQEIVDKLKRTPTCPACVIEGQERYCSCWRARKLGRRLDRLLKRARCEIMPWETAEDAKQRTPR